MNSYDQVVTIAEAARRCGVSRDRITYLFPKDIPPYYTSEGRRYLVEGQMEQVKIAVSKPRSRGRPPKARTQ